MVIACVTKRKCGIEWPRIFITKTAASAKSDGCRITTRDQSDHKHKSGQHGEGKGRRSPAGRFVRIGHQVNPKSHFFRRRTVTDSCSVHISARKLVFCYGFRNCDIFVAAMHSANGAKAVENTGDATLSF
jgi:hypothetical protein